MMRWSRPVETAYSLDEEHYCPEAVAQLLVDAGVDVEVVRQVTEEFQLLEPLRGDRDDG